VLSDILAEENTNHIRQQTDEYSHQAHHTRTCSAENITGAPTGGALRAQPGGGMLLFGDGDFDSNNTLPSSIPGKFLAS
jgi:hypothetical protein